MVISELRIKNKNWEGGRENFFLAAAISCRQKEAVALGPSCAKHFQYVYI